MVPRFHRCNTVSRHFLVAAPMLQCNALIIPSLLLMIQHAVPNCGRLQTKQFSHYILLVEICSSELMLSSISVGVASVSRHMLALRLCCKKSTNLLELGEKSKRGPLMAEQHPFTWRHFQADIIRLCVRWYLRIHSATEISKRSCSNEACLSIIPRSLAGFSTLRPNWNSVVALT